MRLLVDESLPKSLDRAPNAHGVLIDRYKGSVSDDELFRYAAAEGYDALLLLDAEIIARRKLDDAQGRRVVVLCSVTDDPFEAETNLRHSFPSLAEHIRSAAGNVLWLRKDGIRSE